jgi:hypothetical protein
LNALTLKDVVLFKTVGEKVMPMKKEEDIRKMLRDLNKAKRFFEREEMTEDCGYKVTLAQIRIVKEILGDPVIPEAVN